ncbi:MAG TPA: hypothetical protein VF707_20765 [Ardenticatenaceae bacterium]
MIPLVIAGQIQLVDGTLTIGANKCEYKSPRPQPEGGEGGAKQAVAPKMYLL